MAGHLVDIIEAEVSKLRSEFNKCLKKLIKEIPSPGDKFSVHKLEVGFEELKVSGTKLAKLYAASWSHTNFRNPLFGLRVRVESIQFILNGRDYSEPELQSELDVRYATIAMEYNDARGSAQRLPSKLTEFLRWPLPAGEAVFGPPSRDEYNDLILWVIASAGLSFVVCAIIVLRICQVVAVIGVNE